MHETSTIDWLAVATVAGARQLAGVDGPGPVAAARRAADAPSQRARAAGRAAPRPGRCAAPLLPAVAGAGVAARAGGPGPGCRRMDAGATGAALAHAVAVAMVGTGRRRAGGAAGRRARRRARGAARECARGCVDTSDRCGAAADAATGAGRAPGLRPAGADRRHHRGAGLARCPAGHAVGGLAGGPISTGARAARLPPAYSAPCSRSSTSPPAACCCPCSCTCSSTPACCCFARRRCRPLAGAMTGRPEHEWARAHARVAAV